MVCHKRPAGGPVKYEPIAHSYPKASTQCWMAEIDGDQESHYLALHQGSRHVT